MSGVGGDAVATTNPTVSAYLGNNSAVNVTGNIAVVATSMIGGSALMKGVSGALVNVDESNANVTLTPTVNSYIGSNATLVAGGTITVESVHGRAAAPVSDGTFTQSQVNETPVQANVSTVLTTPTNGIVLSPSDLELYTGEPIVYSTSGTAIGGLKDGTTYYAIPIPSIPGFIPPGFIQVASSVDNAEKDDPITLKSAGTGTFTLPDNEITFTLPDGLVTGNIVTYAQNGNPAIGGLTDGQVYQVIPVPGSANTIKLGPSFDAASVNTVDDTIVFPSDDDLQTGDLVIYENNSGTPIGGLTPGELYKVLVIDPETIKLQDPTQTYKTPTSFNPYTTVNTDPTKYPNSIHLSGFADGDAVTYNAPPAVDAAGSQVTANTARPPEDTIIDLGKDPTTNDPILDNFSNGQQVIYTLGPGADPIGGLTPGTTYQVITKASNEFELAQVIIKNGKPTYNSTPIILDGTVATGEQIFTGADWQPIGGLNDGQTYYVINDASNYFQLANTPGGGAITLTVSTNTEGKDTIGVEGLVFTSAGSGTQDLVFPLAANDPRETGKYQLIGVGGAAGLLPTPAALFSAPPADGLANAGAISSGGGGVQVGGADSTATSNPTVTTSVGSDANLTAAGDITILSTSYANASADGTDSGGGFVAVGEGDANVSTSNSNTAQIGNGAVITTQGNFTLQAISYNNVDGSSDSRGGGVVKIGHATTTGNIDYQTLASVGQDAQVTAGSALLVDSESNTLGVGNTTTDGSGLGVGAHADDDLYIGSPLDDSDVASTQTTVGTGATLTGQDTTVNAVTAYNTTANSTSLASAFAADSSCASVADANATSHVSISSGATIAGSHYVNILDNTAINSDVADANAHCDAAFGSATSNTTTQIFGPSHYDASQPDMSQVDAAGGATIQSPYLLVSVQGGADKVADNDYSGGGFIVGHYEDYTGNTWDNRTIHWNANVVSPAPAAGTVLMVDANGNVEPSSTITPTITPTQIIVPDIGNTAGGLVVFYVDQFLTYGFSKHETNDSNLGLIDGNEATFFYQQTPSAITLLNDSTKDLVVNNIECADSGNLDPDNPNVEINVADDNTLFDAFAFNVVYTYAPTLVDIENTSTVDAPNIILQGSIDNPIGTTKIINASGSIQSIGSQATVTTNILDVSAPDGEIGSPADPLNADLVQSEDTKQVERPIQATVLAGGNAYLNLTGVLRDPDFNLSQTPFTVPLSSIQAGGEIVGTLRESVQDTSNGPAGFGIIVDEDYGANNTITDVTTHFRPRTGNGPSSSIDPGFLDGGASLIASTYSFGNLTAGGNIELTGVPASTTVNRQPVTPVINIAGFTNINPSPSATGQIDASTNGDIALTETEGAMRVGQIELDRRQGLADRPPERSVGRRLAAGQRLEHQRHPGLGSADVADNVIVPVGSTITAKSKVEIIQGNYAEPPAGSLPDNIISISGQIFAAAAFIQGGVYNNDVIGLTNVTPGTVTTVNSGGGVNTVNVGSIPPPTPNDGDVDNIQGPLTVIGNGADTMNVDDTGSAVSRTGTLTSSALFGLGMAPTGIVYSGLAYLNINLGTAADQFNVQSSAAGTTSTITTQATGNTWNVGSLAPTVSGGVLSGIQGPVIIDGGGSQTALTDTLNFDDSGSTAPNETGGLTDSTLTGHGMGTGGVTFVGQAVLNINLGNNNTRLQGNITYNLPATTTITGGPSDGDAFGCNWANDFNGTLNLSHLGSIGLIVAGEFYGHVKATSPARIDELVVGGSVNAGSSIEAQEIDLLDIGVDLDINLTLPGIAGAPAGTNALGVGIIGGSLPQGITLAAGSIGVLVVGTNDTLPAGSNNLAGTVTVFSNLGTLEVGSAGSITTTAHVNVGGNLNTLTMEGATPNVGQVMAGVITVIGTLGTATIAGGTPGLFIAGHVGTIGAYGGFGTVVLRVIEAGVERWLEEDPAGTVFSQPNAADTATTPGDPNYINTQYFYESAGFASPQISARITNGVSSAPDQFDLSTVVFQDGASFNLDRLDASGVSGIGNVAVEGDLVTTLSAAAENFFLLPGGSPDPSPAGVYLPSDDLASVSVRDYAPNGSIVAAEIQGVAFGSFTNSSGQVEPGSQATNSDAANLLAPGTAIVQAGSVSGQGTETFRVPFAALAGQQLAFFLDTASGGGVFDPNNMVLTLESDGDGIDAPELFPATRGAVTGLIGVDAVAPGSPGSEVQTVDLHGDGGSIYSGQFIAQSITSTGPLGDLTILSPLGLNNVTAPSIFGNIAASGPIFGTIQTTGVRTDPVTGAVTQVNADLGRVFVVPAGGRNLQPYVTATTIGGELPGSLAFTGRIISRGNLISQVRSDGGASGLVAVQGNFGAITSLLGTPTRVGGLLVNGGFGGQLVVLGNDYGDLTFNGGLGLTVNGVVTGGRIAVQGTGGAQSGIVGNVVIDRGFYSYGGISAGSAIVSGGEIGDASLGTTLSAQDSNSGIVAADGVINMPTAVGGTVFNNVGAAPGNPNAAVIDAIFSQGVSPLSPIDLFDESTLLDLANLIQIQTNLNSLKVITVNNQKQLSL